MGQVWNLIPTPSQNIRPVKAFAIGIRANTRYLAAYSGYPTPYSSIKSYPKHGLLSSFKTYHKWVNHSTTDNMLDVSVSFHVYALK